MYIEDIFQLLVKIGKLGIYDKDIALDFSRQISAGKNFTEKQANLMVKITKKYQTQLEKILTQDISIYLDNPTFKMPFRTTNYQKSMKICDHTLYKKAIKIEFPYNEEILTKLRSCRSVDYTSLRFSYYDKDEKSWFFALLEKNILVLMPIIKEFNFEIDSELADYIKKIEEVQKNIEHYLPMVVKREEKYKIINLPPYVNITETEDLLESLLLARKHGVCLWSDEINQILTSEIFNEAVINFIKSEPTEHFELDLSKLNFETIAPIVKCLLPCLVIIPGGTELEKTQTAVKFFQSIELKNTEMSVLFRLQNSTDANFNQFVKSNQLNNPVTDDTQVVFLSQHVPKTILSPMKKFNSLLNFNYVNVHHKLATLIRTQENVINVLEKSNQRRLNFARL